MSKIDSRISLPRQRVDQFILTTLNDKDKLSERAWKKQRERERGGGGGGGEIDRQTQTEIGTEADRD